MRTLHISVLDKKAIYANRDGDIVCGNNDYMIEFAFDAEWDGYDEKTARFIWNGAYKDVTFTGATCPVPIITNTTAVEIGVYAGELSTTTPAVIGCQKSILCQSTTPGGTPFTKGEKGDQGEKGERGDTDNIREVVEVFLDAGYWENNKQTIPCSSVGENSAVFPNPTAESKNDYIIAGIELTEATAESLTFTCSYVPTNDIDVLVYITDPVIVVDGNGVPEITEKDANKVLTANEDGTAEWKDPTGGEGVTMVVNVTRTNNGTFEGIYSSDKSISEILEAYDNGKRIVFDLLHSGYHWIFTDGVIALTNRTPYQGLIEYSNDIMYFTADNATTENNVDSFKASMRENNELPESTEDDSGKVLTVCEDGTAGWKDPTGGVKSWNDLEDKPFYEETVTGEVVIEYDGDSTGKVVVSMGEDGQLVKVSDLTPEPSELIGGTATVGGQSMTITTDDIEDARPAGMPGASVGGGMLMIAYEPFPAYGITEAGMYIVDMGVPATLKYTGTVTNIKKLDMKFLEFSKVSDTALVDETVTVSADGGTFSNAFTLIVGKTYLVEIDGTRYSCVAKTLSLGDAAYLYVGNLKFVGFSEDSGEPFCIIQVDGIWKITVEAGEYSIKIYHVECAKIPKECLPEDIGSSGLPEVTAEDNGKFLQVVDGAYALVALQDVSKEGA